MARNCWLAAASMAAMAWAGAAHAQATDPAPAPDEARGEIIITARKTAERLSDAPVSVSALTGNQIRELGLNSIDDFARQATGISFSQAFGRSSDRPVVRGQSNVLANVQFGVETGAAYFIDGIYYQGDIQGFDPEAIARIEIIKGPQSALYGRNTYAGAINYVTRDPSDTLTINGRASAAGHDEYAVSAAVSGPIGDMIGFRLGGRYYTYGGEYTNQLTGKKVGDEETKSAYALITVEPSTNFRVRLRGQYQADDDGPLAIFLQGANSNNCRPGFRSLRYRQRNLPPPVPITPGTTFQPAIAGISNNDNQYFCGEIKPQPNNVRLNTDPIDTGLFGVRDGTAFDGIENTQWLASGIMEWDIGGSGWVLSSLTGYRRNTNLFGTDSDHSEGFFFLFPSPNNLNPAFEPAFANTNRDKTWDVSQEVRLATPSGGRWRGLVGAYYFKQEFQTVDLTFANPRRGEVLGSNGSAFSTIQDVAVFGLVGFDLTDRLTITGEARWAQETKTIIERAAATSIFCAGQSGRAAQFGFTGTCQGKGRWTGVDPRITLDWKPNDDLLIYAVFAQGRKPGGFNGTGGLSAGALTGENLVQYAPEKARGGELGAKLTALDRRLGLNVALFYNDLSSVQLTRAVPPTVPGQAITSIVTNQGDAETKGFEFEMRLAASERLDLSASLSYVDARFTSGCDFDLFVLNSGGLRPNFDTNKPTAAGLPLCDISGNRLPLGSPWTINGSATYTLPLSSSGWELTTNLNWSWEDRKFIQTDNFAWAGDAFLLNARIGVRNDRFSITAFGRNLTDEDSIPLATRWFDYRYGNARRDVGTTGVFDGQPAGVETGAPRAFFATLRRGRTFGVEGTFRF